MENVMEMLDVVFSAKVEVVVDDVSDFSGTEFRASLYQVDDFVTEGWGSSVSEAIDCAFRNLLGEVVI
jgi:hypothetical protein